jgi:hypothetical protein
MNKDSPQKTLIKSFIIGGIAIALGVVLIITGNMMQREQEHLQQVCTANTEGFVFGFTVIGEIINDEDYRQYKPIFQYEAGGRIYIKEHEFSKEEDKLPFIKGQTVTIWYNPDNPDEYYLTELLVTETGNIVMKWFSIFLIVFGMFPIVFNGIKYLKKK